MRTLRWVLLVACLAGLAYVAWAVPLGGQTLWDRLRGAPAPATPAAAEAQAAARPAPGGSGPARPEPGGPGAAQPAEPAPPPADLTTDSDRQALDRLIEGKLKASPEAGGPAAR
ncbi:MAG TPA: hypothetical protein PK668_19400 [Myxococcota bacterium]|nr:hypothetical protein [Myxococcota bacterium]HRY95102.1 hypothetical protein [Myxococcota bacterium]